MTFNYPSILEKVIRFRALKHTEKGGLTLWDIPCALFPMFTVAHMQRVMEDSIGYGKARDILFQMGKVQATQAIDLVNKRFGYAETITDKKKLLEFNIGQISVAGHGLYRLVRADFKNEIFIVKGITSAAKEYSRLFGKQKIGTDHFKRGELSALLGTIMKKDYLAIETECMACGKKECQIIIKPVKKWDKKDPVVKKQYPNKLSDLKELGMKKELYLTIPK